MAENVHQRLAKAMRAVSYVQRERKQGMNYTITSHDAVTAKVRPALLEAGIVYYPVRCDHLHNGNRAECSMTVRFVNVDEPTDFFDVPSFGYGIDPQDKGPGKAMSYAVKYALLKALGLETGDDPEVDSIDHTPDERAAKPPAAPAPKPRDVANEMIDHIKSRKDEDAMNRLEAHPKFKADLAFLVEAAPPMALEVKAAFDKRMDELNQKEVA